MQRFLFLAFCLSVMGEENIDEDSMPDFNEQCKMENGGLGVCVPFYLCNDNNTLSVHGEFIIDIRSTKCQDYLNVCCAMPAQQNGDVDSDADKYMQIDQNTEVYNSCGRRNSDGIVMRTIGDVDNETKFGEFPWVVAVLREHSLGKSLFLGGGSLIHPKVALTAAHLVNGTMWVRAGEWDSTTNKEIYSHQQIVVADIVIHEKFNRANVHYDIAMLFLSSPMHLTVHVGVVCLPPPRTQPPVGTRCLSAGWGKDDFEKGRYQNILRKVEIAVVDHAACQKSLRTTRLGRHFKLHRSFMCAGGEANKDTCVGDGGAPLACPIPVFSPGILPFRSTYEGPRRGSSLARGAIELVVGNC